MTLKDQAPDWGLDPGRSLTYEGDLRAIFWPGRMRECESSTSHGKGEFQDDFTIF